MRGLGHGTGFCHASRSCTPPSKAANWRRHAHHAIEDGWLFEGAILRPLPVEHQPAAVPDDDPTRSARLARNTSAMPESGSCRSTSFANAARPSTPFLKSTGLVGIPLSQPAVNAHYRAGDLDREVRGLRNRCWGRRCRIGDDGDECRCFAEVNRSSIASQPVYASRRHS
jgi:hypothetical protein